LAETGAVQRFSLENEEKYINVLKVITDGTNEYAAEGAELALYRADEAGNYVEDEAHLIETWLSGSDGRYTENDRFNGDMPDKVGHAVLEGFSVGDLKPHRIDKTPYGTYYIAELTAPAYMQKIEPVKILVGAEKIPVYRVVNTPTVGTLDIIKKASDTGEGLENARFKVSNKDTGEVWYMTTGIDGKAKITGLPVGLVKSEGTIKPYTYAIEEISPPDLYQITAGIRKFQFDGTESGKEVLYTYKILNDPTEIHFKKTNFDTGLAVEGAEIAVYEAVAIDGEYQKAGEAIETFISGPDGFTLTKKLSANRVYVMEELKAPAGYTLSKPVIFTLNNAGTGIKNVSNDFSILKLASDNGAIENLTVTGRVPVKVYTILKDLDAGTELPPFIGTGSGQAVTAKDGIINGHTYEITEYTKFSDGRTEKSSKEIKRIYFDKDGSYTIPSRTYLGTRQELADAEGNVLASWTVNEDNHDYVIKNPVTREIPIAQVTSSIGADHSAVKTGSVIKYTVTYSNPYNHSVDIRINAVLKDGLDYLRSTDYGAEQNGIIIWNLTDIAAHESGAVDVVAVVSGETGTLANVHFETKAGTVMKRTTLTNPIVPEGSITILNKLTGSGKDHTDEFTFHVRLMDSAGKTLTGYQAYSGSAEGRIKGEGNITISGDGNLTFAGLPYGTRYEIAQEPKDGYELEEGMITGEVTKAIQSAVFKNNRNNETIREILTAGGNYRLTELTTYNDGSSLISGVYRFQLNASGMVDNVDMEDQPIHLYFSKVDVETGEELTGGRYNLIDTETGNIIFEFTKEEGKEVLIPAELITPGKEYIILEEQSPAGYSYEKEIRFVAEESGIRSTIIMQDKKTEVEILKADTETGDMLTGGRFSIREMDTGTLIKEFTANGGPIVLTGLLIAGKTYELSEEEPPAGYAYSESVIFTVPEEPGLITVLMKDKKTDVLIKKLKGSLLIDTPSEAASQLPGSTLQILNEDKTPARAIRDGNGFKAGDDLIFTTSQQFEELKGQLEAGKDYWLHEISPANGYAYAEDIRFTVSINGDEDVIVMIDDPTHVILSKKAITGSEELPGNHMSVKDKDGNIVEEWISGEQPHELIAKLIAGERYWLHEIRPVDGYSYAEDVSFIVSKNGTVDMVEMKNEVTAVRLNKVNTTGAFLKGAILQVLDHQKNVVIPDFETTDEAIDITGRLEAGKTYCLHEVKAPSGYLLSSDIAFTVPKGSGLLEVTMTDPKQQSPGSDKMYLYKTDAATGQGIKGVEFSIYRPNGSLYLTVNTGEGGYAKFDMPENGTYTFKETKAAPGYLATNHIYSFTIQNGEVSGNSTISVVNYLSPEVIIKKADAETMERLAGADLEIRNEAGELVFKGMTDENGVISFYPLRSGKYTVHETKAPKGYIKTNSYLTIYVTADGTVSGEFTMLNSPESGKKKGFITAKYQSNLNGLGIASHKGKGFWGWLSRLPKTGDVGMGGGLLLCLGLAGIVTGITIVRRRSDKKDES
jgi:uncharacterized surface anchored protein